MKHPTAAGQLRAGLCGLLALAGGLLAASSVEAQPNPFDAWRSSQETPDADAAAQGEQPAPEPRAAAPVWRGLKAGDFSFSGHLLYSGTSTTNGLIGGGEADNGTLFLDIAPTFGWFIIDQLELYGTLGLLVSKLDRNNAGDGTLATQVLLGAGARYYVPLRDQFSLYGGIGLGGYVGGSTRSFTSTNTDGSAGASIKQDTDTRGVALDVEVGAGYLITPHVQLRAGLALVGLWGSETVNTTDLDTALLHNGVRLGLGYLF